MPGLLVTSPSGRQEIIQISESGSYFDAALILWDERTDGTLPELALGKMQRSGDRLITLPDHLPAHASALLAEAKIAKLEEIQTAYDAASYANISYAGKTWRADKDSQQLLSAVLAPGSVPPGMYWRDITGARNIMTFADLQALARAILDRGLTLDEKFEIKKAAVASAGSVAAVNTITWGD